MFEYMLPLINFLLAPLQLAELDPLAVDFLGSLFAESGPTAILFRLLTISGLAPFQVT